MTRPYFLGPANNVPTISSVIEMFNIAKRSDDPIQRFFSLAKLSTPLDRVAHSSWAHELALVDEVRHHQLKEMSAAFNKSPLPGLFVENAAEDRGLVTQEGFYAMRKGEGKDVEYKVSRFSLLGLREEPMLAFKSLANNSYAVTRVAGSKKIEKLERAIHEMLYSRALNALS